MQQASDREAYRQRVKEDAQRKLEARSREVAEKAARKEQLIAEQRRAHMKELEVLHTSNHTPGSHQTLQ